MLFLYQRSLTNLIVEKPGVLHVIGISSMSSFILVAISQRGKREYTQLVLTGEKLILNSTEVLLDDIMGLEAEITEHVRVVTYTGEKVLEKLVPFGHIIFVLRNNEKHKIVLFNPLVKAEELVEKLNSIYSKHGKPLLRLFDSNAYKSFYSRTI